MAKDEEAKKIWSCRVIVKNFEDLHCVVRCLYYKDLSASKWMVDFRKIKMKAEVLIRKACEC